MKRSSKIILAGITFIMLLLIIFIIIFLNRRSADENQVIDESGFIEREVFIEEDYAGQEINKTKIEKIEEAEIKDDIIYYYSEERGEYGKIYLSNGQEKTEILANNLYNMSNAQISPTGNNLLNKDLNTGVYNILNFRTKGKNQLNDLIIYAVWYPSDNDDFIVSSYSNPSFNNLNLYNWRKDDREQLIKLFLGNAVDIEVSPDLSQIIYSNWTYEELDINIVEELVNFNIYDLDARELLYETDRIAVGKYNSDGSKILAMENSQVEFSQFIIIDAKNLSENIIDLNTYFNKIGFANDPNILIYARVEESQGESTSDTLWKLNLNTGEKTQITKLDDSVNYDISNIMVSSDDKIVYFVNKLDKKLYSVELE